MVGDRLVVHDLVVDDECAVRVVSERTQAGEDASKVVRDAVEIGTRVLDREQAAANSEYVKTEFERASRELESQFTEKARLVAEHFGEKVDEVFGPENGQLARDLERRFGDGSAASVQNRVRELVGEALVKSREDLVRQFSAADGANPLADFKAGALESINQAANRSHATQRALLEKLAELQKELQALRDEKDKLEEIDAERERGTAKGRDFEELVAESVDALALRQGDVAESVGDQKGAAGKTGDVVVAVGACDGPPRGRIVFEAKDRKLSRPTAMAELDRALTDRDADFAVLVVPTEAELPAKLQPLREYNGDKLLVVLDAEDATGLSLEVAYRLARARVLMARGGEGVDGAAVHDLVERALASMEDVRKVKSHLTGAKTNIDTAYRVVDEMTLRVRAHLADVDALVFAGDPGEQAVPPDDQLEL
ncbi:MAG: hypothetical protein H0U84_00765 [Thermoleophilaceae bacterium]|nr:hypothetical protein [Thermoleophilaceae bacterium]